jgi:hypothetical protein
MREADRFGRELAASNWWLVKVQGDEQSVLGDAVVVATIQIGHDDQWRRLIDPETYAGVMALSSELALVVGRILPIGVEVQELVGALNLGFYKAADRYCN